MINRIICFLFHGEHHRIEKAEGKRKIGWRCEKCDNEWEETLN